MLPFVVLVKAICLLLGGSLLTVKLQQEFILSKFGSFFAINGVVTGTVTHIVVEVIEIVRPEEIIKSIQPTEPPMPLLAGAPLPSSGATFPISFLIQFLMLIFWLCFVLYVAYKVNMGCLDSTFSMIFSKILGISRVGHAFMHQLRCFLLARSRVLILRGCDLALLLFGIFWSCLWFSLKKICQASLWVARKILFTYGPMILNFVVRAGWKLFSVIFRMIRGFLKAKQEQRSIVSKHEVDPQQVVPHECHSLDFETPVLSEVERKGPATSRPQPVISQVQRKGPATSRPLRSILKTPKHHYLNRSDEEKRPATPRPSEDKHDLDDKPDFARSDDEDKDSSPDSDSAAIIKSADEGEETANSEPEITIVESASTTVPVNIDTNILPATDLPSVPDLASSIPDNSPLEDHTEYLAHAPSVSGFQDEDTEMSDVSMEEQQVEEEKWDAMEGIIMGSGEYEEESASQPMDVDSESQQSPEVDVEMGGFWTVQPVTSEMAGLMEVDQMHQQADRDHEMTDIQPDNDVEMLDIDTAAPGHSNTQAPVTSEPDVMEGVITHLPLGRGNDRAAGVANGSNRTGPLPPPSQAGRPRSMPVTTSGAMKLPMLHPDPSMSGSLAPAEASKPPAPTPSEAPKEKKEKEIAFGMESLGEAVAEASKSLEEALSRVAEEARGIPDPPPDDDTSYLQDPDEDLHGASPTRNPTHSEDDDPNNLFVPETAHGQSILDQMGPNPELQIPAGAEEDPTWKSLFSEMDNDPSLRLPAVEFPEWTKDLSGFGSGENTQLGQ